MNGFRGAGHAPRQATARCWQRSALVAAFGFALACVNTPAPAPEPLAGCYYFERDTVAERLRLPWGIRLQSDTLTGWPAIQQLAGVRRASTLVGPGEEQSFPFGYWRPLNADSLEIGYPAGGGLVLELAVASERLVGTARAVGDVLPPPGQTVEPPRDPVLLLYARCP